MKIYESAEDYLEAILSLQERHGMVRSIDIANELHFSKPSVSVAMKKLRESGYVEMNRDGRITLLPPGEEVAAADACKVEHDLSEETFCRIKEHVYRQPGADAPAPGSRPER